MTRTDRQEGDHPFLALPAAARAARRLDDELDAGPDREPEYVVRFGVQAKPIGVIAGTPRVDKMIGHGGELGRLVDAACQGQAPDPVAWERPDPTTPTCPG